MTNGQNLIKNILKGIQWSALESFGYQLLFLGHQAALFNVVDRNFYGVIGSTFSYMYLMVFIAHLGFDGSLARSLASWESNGSALIKKVLLHIATSFLLGLVSLCIMWSTGLTTPAVTFLMSAVIVSEATRKMFRSILQLTFNNKLTMKSEFFFIAFYCFFVWTPVVYYNQPITLPGILIPLVTSSIITSIILCAQIVSQYSLSSGSCQKTYRSLYKERMTPGLYQLSTIFFTSNCLVLLLGKLFGMSCAGNAKFIVTIIYTLTAVIHKIFDISSSTLFAHLGQDQNKQPYFATISSLLYKTIACTLSVLAAFSPILIHDSTQQVTLVFFFSAMSILELIIIPYEKLYIMEGKIHYITITNIATSLGFIALTFSHPTSIQIITVSLVIARAISLLAIIKHAHLLWQLTPYGKTLSSYLIGIVATTAFIFFLLN